MEMDFVIETKGMQKVQRKLNTLIPQRVKVVLLKSHNRIKLVILKTAHSYAPISPTKGQYVGTLVGGKSGRTTLNPGGLTRSIIGKATDEFVEIFVPSNSEAGSYAKKMHEWEGSWGAGTKARGSQAGNQFITRAIKDNEENIVKIYEDELDKEINRLNHGKL